MILFFVYKFIPLFVYFLPKVPPFGGGGPVEGVGEDELRLARLPKDCIQGRVAIVVQECKVKLSLALLRPQEGPKIAVCAL